MSFPIFIRCFIMVTPFQADVCRERFSCLSQHYSVFSLRITLQNLSVEISNIFFEIGIDGTNLNAVEHFTYLGSVISNDATVSKNLDSRLSKASSSFGRLSEYGRATRSASPRSTGYTGPSSFPPSCEMQRPGFSIRSRSGYWSGFTNAACVPSLASNGKTTCQIKKSSRKPACPA